MRILVCGGRDFTDKNLLEKILDSYIYGPEDVVISGAARGADTLAADFGNRKGAYVKEYPADWGTYGSAAGPIRNQQMLDEGKPDIVIAFPSQNSRGTYDMIRRAKKAGVEVRIIE